MAQSFNSISALNGTGGRWSLALTINKAQGQTLAVVGLFLLSPVFSHGQLYVGLSRGSSRDGIKVLSMEGADRGRVGNVVWLEVL